MGVDWEEGDGENDYYLKKNQNKTNILSPALQFSDRLWISQMHFGFSIWHFLFKFQICSKQIHTHKKGTEHTGRCVLRFSLSS